MFGPSVVAGRSPDGVAEAAGTGPAACALGMAPGDASPRARHAAQAKAADNDGAARENGARRMESARSIASMHSGAACGQLIVGGFPGASLPPRFERALREGRRGGAVLFKPNVEGGPYAVASLTRHIRACSEKPPLIAIDQEGGRVARLRGPLLEVPPMRAVGAWGDVVLAERIARAVGLELAALGFNVDFAPVLDVDTRAGNPVIGDRSFSADAETCARLDAAWIRGLQGAGVIATGKHFPGHGDTSSDSHVDLPTVQQPRDRIDRVELVPFRAGVVAGVGALMTAHVVYTAVDDARPATLSPAVCTTLRDAIGFDGVLFSDDLEMAAIAARFTVEDAAVQAVAAGCDALLVCWSEEKQERAFEALLRESEQSPAFRARCEQACRRVTAARAATPVEHSDDEAIARVLGGRESREVAAEIARRTPR